VTPSPRGQLSFTTPCRRRKVPGKGYLGECLPIYHYISQVKLPGKPLPTPICPKLLSGCYLRPYEIGLPIRACYTKILYRNGDGEVVMGRQV